jgi:DNA-binding transcriptional MocR family regulator
MLKHTQTRGCEALSQLAVSAFMKSPSYERYLRRLRKILTEQRQQTSTAIIRYFPAGTRATAPRGGTLLWVELPRQLSAMTLFHEALKVGIQITPGDIFSNTQRFGHCLRIACGTPFSSRIDEALQTLGRLLDEQR